MNENDRLFSAMGIADRDLAVACLKQLIACSHCTSPFRSTCFAAIGSDEIGFDPVKTAPEFLQGSIEPAGIDDDNADEDEDGDGDEKKDRDEEENEDDDDDDHDDEDDDEDDAYEDDDDDDKDDDESIPLFACCDKPVTCCAKREC